MQIFHNFVLFFVCGCNAYLFYVVTKYRKMLGNSHQHFIEMHHVSEKYRKLLEEERGKNAKKPSL